MSTVDQLIELIRDRQFHEAEQMLEQQPHLTTAHSATFHGVTPLHWAGHRNAVGVCQYLLTLGADVNDSSGDWWRTPLAWAADAASVEAVELLLQHGADIDQDVVVGFTALHAVAMGGSSQGTAEPHRYRQTAELLIAAGADLNHRSKSGCTPLDEAIRCTNAAVAEVLTAHGARQTKNSPRP